jgi:DNA-binding MarR family transcriptional regulator
LTSIVDKLEAQSLVRRERSTEDRRVVFVELTPTGRAAYGAAVDEKRSLRRLLLGGHGAEDPEKFMAR